MSTNTSSPQARGLMVFIFLLANVILLRASFVESNQWYWLLMIGLLLLLMFNKTKFHNMDTNNKNEMNPVILAESDFHVLKRLASSQPPPADGRSLSEEVSRAVVVKDHAFPPNTIRLNTTVQIMNLETEQVFEYKIVLPQSADIRSKKISVLSPMGIALIGFREGDTVTWKMPGGLKSFRVLKADNSVSEQQLAQVESRA